MLCYHITLVVSRGRQNSFTCHSSLSLFTPHIVLPSLFSQLLPLSLPLWSLEQWGKCLRLAYTFRENGGVGPLGGCQAQTVALAEWGLGLAKPLLATAESRQKAQWQLRIVALPSGGPRRSRQHERDYDQLWPLRTAVPFVTTFSFFWAPRPHE